MNQSESSPWDLIAKIGAVLGFVVLLLNFVGQVLDLVQNSEGTRTALFVVFVLYFMATVWLAFRPSNISQGVRRLSLGVLYVVTIGYAVWVGTWLVPGPDESVVIPADDADGGVKVDLLSKSTYAFNGLQDVSVRNGVGRVFLERNGENDFDYKFEYDIDDAGGGYAGFVFRFSPPLDLSEFDALEVVLEVGDEAANCDIYLKQGDVANYIRVCDGSFVNGVNVESQTNRGEMTVLIPLPLNFLDVDHDVIDEIGFSVNSEFTTGFHSFTVFDVRLLK